MTQATQQDTPSAPRVDTTAAAMRAFCMEASISDLAEMVRIAELTLHSVIGETEFDGAGEVVHHNLTTESVGRAIFTVSHLASMIEALQQKHYGALPLASATH